MFCIFTLPCSSMASLPQNAVLPDPVWAYYKLQFFKICSIMGLYHRLLSFGNIAPVWVAAIDRSRALPGQGPPPAGALTSFRPHPPAALWAPVWAACEELLCCGRRLLQHRSLLGCRELPFCACSPPALTLVAVGLFLSHFSLLSPRCCDSHLQLLLNSIFSLSSICSPRAHPV